MIETGENGIEGTKAAPGEASALPAAVEVPAPAKRPPLLSGAWDLLHDVSITVLFCFFIVTFVAQPVRVQGASMQPRIEDNERIVVNKAIYRFQQVARGDVVVFYYPRDPSVSYIKRVIGLPGDRIQMMNGLLHINGQPVKRERIEDYIETEETERATRVKRWRETLPNGVSYTTLDLVDNGFYDSTPEYNVPQGQYFMMGDNRDNSTDSRVLSQVGYVPFENLIGRAQIIFFSVAEGQRAWQFWLWPWTVRWGRLFTIVR